jgi:hypothetical protein
MLLTSWVLQVLGVQGSIFMASGHWVALLPLTTCQFLQWCTPLFVPALKGILNVMLALLVHYLQTEVKQSLHNNALFLFQRALWMLNALLVERPCVREIGCLTQAL